SMCAPIVPQARRMSLGCFRVAMSTSSSYEITLLVGNKWRTFKNLRPLLPDFCHRMNRYLKPMRSESPLSSKTESMIELVRLSPLEKHRQDRGYERCLQKQDRHC